MNTKAPRAAAEHESLYKITRFDRIMLAYGGICGFLLVLYASGNPLLGVILGVPPAMLGFGIPMLVHKRFAPTDDSFTTLPLQKRRRIGLTVTGTIAALLGYRVLIGDWFGFACTIMLAGAIMVAFANASSNLRSENPASGR